MSNPRPIFFDPTGKRRQIARVGLALGLTVVAILYILGEVLFVESPLTSLNRAQPPREPTFELRNVLASPPSPEAVKRSRDALVRELQQARTRVKTQKESLSESARVAFLNRIDEPTLFVLRTQREKITHIAPAWLSLETGATPEETELSTALGSPEQNPFNTALKEFAASEGLKLLPRLIVPSQQHGQSPFVIPSHSAAQQRIALSIAQYLEQAELPGILLDLHPTTAAASNALYSLVSEIISTCHAVSKQVHLVSYLNDTLTFSKIPTTLDGLHVVAMYRPQTPGPLASLKSVGDKLLTATKVFPPGKIGVIFASGASTHTNSSSNKSSEFVDFSEAMAAATNAQFSFDPSSGTSRYTAASNSKSSDHTWLLDAPFAFNARLLAEARNISHFGIWGVGGEDSGLWEILSPAPSLADIEHVAPTSPLSSFGEGDLLSVSLSGVAEGARTFTVDAGSSLITSVTYRSIPQAPRTEHSGFKPQSIALTFDDGPAEPFTSQILDTLKKHQVKATFFVVGERVLEYPHLIRRIYDEGHDLGNHSFSHPNLSLVGRHRVTLELNATQRALQSVLGRSVHLFRPPYISEGSPLSMEEFRVMSIAQDLGYTIVGITTHGRDWVHSRTQHDGSEVSRTGDDIAQEILSKLDHATGNAILLHDGPEERERTVEAVEILIPELKKRGVKFSTTHELLGTPRDAVMPVIASNIPRQLHRTLLTLFSWGSWLFSLIFLLLVIFGVLRLIVILVSAILAKLEEIRNPCTPEQLEQSRDIPVSIIIAAYNEERVITATIESLLAGNHRTYEIIIVDDGSKDRTSEVVREKFGAHPLVKLIRQVNGGKSSALNHGIQNARYDILVCLDADTQFNADAITYLARHFKDPTVGGVAGNIKVGNRRSILTHWQSMEYITNISIGRRAYGYFNSIMVVAGAAGAWRRSALLDAGGYHSDSLAEDMDVTWRVRRNDWKVVNEPLAIGYTEAPENFRGLYKQRFRWSYGALQCLWKHRDAIGKNGFFGWVGVPSIFIFGCLFELLAPLADLKMLLVILSFARFMSSGHSIQPGTLEYESVVAPMVTAAVLYAVFFVVELLISVLAFYLDDEDMKPLWLLFFQRFAYRQLMYLVAIRAVWKAITGWKQGWGNLERTGTVSLPPAPS